MTLLFLFSDFSSQCWCAEKERDQSKYCEEGKGEFLFVSVQVLIITTRMTLVYRWFIVLQLGVPFSTLLNGVTVEVWKRRSIKISFLLFWTPPPLNLPPWHGVWFVPPPALLSRSSSCWLTWRSLFLPLLIVISILISTFILCLFSRFFFVFAVSFFILLLHVRCLFSHNYVFYVSSCSAVLLPSSHPHCLQAAFIPSLCILCSRSVN